MSSRLRAHAAILRALDSHMVRLEESEDTCHVSLDFDVHRGEARVNTVQIAERRSLPVSGKGEDV